MKTYVESTMDKIKFWNFFIGLAVGFAAGVILINALVPNTAEMLRLYRLDPKSLQEDREARAATKQEQDASIEIDVI